MRPCVLFNGAENSSRCTASVPTSAAHGHGWVDEREGGCLGLPGQAKF